MHQVGQTVKLMLHSACGINGASRHLAGMGL